jgi:hypothetical protein
LGRARRSSIYAIGGNGGQEPDVRPIPTRLLGAVDGSARPSPHSIVVDFEWWLQQFAGRGSA